MTPSEAIRQIRQLWTDWAEHKIEQNAFAGKVAEILEQVDEAANDER